MYFWELRRKFYAGAKFQTHSKFPKKIPVFRDFTGIFKKYRKTWMHFWNLRSKIYIYAKFRVIQGKFLQKYRFFGVLPVFWQNARNSDIIFEFYDQNYRIPESFKEIDQFFRFSLKPVWTLIIRNRMSASQHTNAQISGRRNPAEYIERKSMGDRSLLSDYRFLEDGSRRLHSLHREINHEMFKPYPKSNRKSLCHQVFTYSTVCQTKFITWRLHENKCAYHSTLTAKKYVL